MYKDGKTYYAFISYNHKDLKWANWLQKKLEGYRLPATLRRSEAKLPKKLSPIGRDQTDASSGIVWDELVEMLDDSNYLIVICSPNSARAEWVGKEINHFRETGRWEKIIPFIVDGEPHSPDPEKECYNPELTRDPDKDLLGASVSELGKTNAVLRIVATMLDLRYDDLVMREKKRTMRRRIIAGACAAAAVCGLIRLADYNIPHVHYYRNYKTIYQIPVGIDELSSSERKSVSICYKIVTQYDGQVQKLEEVNSKGISLDRLSRVTNGNISEADYSYDSSGRLAYTEYKDSSGDILFTSKYSVDREVIDYIWPDDDKLSYFLPLDPSSGIYSKANEEYTEKSTISRVLLKYDKDGNLIRETYRKNSGNQPASDSNGIYGKQYDYNEKGQLCVITNLGSDEKPLRMQHGSAVAYEYYTYTDKGDPESVKYYDADMKPAKSRSGIARIALEYDEFGRKNKEIYYDARDDRTRDDYSVACYSFGYDSNGFLTSIDFYSPDNSPAYCSDGYCGRRFENDQYGRAAVIKYVDEKGDPVCCRNGYALTERTYDPKNRIISERYFDKDGTPTIDHSMASAGWTVEYNDILHTEKYTSFDETSTPALCKEGYASYRISYNGSGKINEVQFYGPGGEPVSAREGYALKKYDYDYSGRLKRISYFDSENKPCFCKDGFSYIEYEYDPNGFIKSERVYDINDAPTWRRYSLDSDTEVFFFERRFINNELGQTEEESFFSPAGLPISQTYATCSVKTKYNDRGKKIRTDFLNAYGSLTETANGYASVKYDYDTNGNCIREAYTDKNDDPVRGIVCLREFGYDAAGNQISVRECTLDHSGNEQWIYEKNEYDAAGRLLSKYRFNKNGVLLPDEKGIAHTRYTYDNRGNTIKTERFDENDKYFGKGDSYHTAAVIESAFDTNGNDLHAAVFYTADADGNIYPEVSGKFKSDKYGNDSEVSFTYLSSGKSYTSLYEYNAMGDNVQCEMRSESGELVPINEWGFAKYTIEYTPRGEESLIAYYGTDGRLMTRESGRMAYEKRMYNGLGVCISTSYFDKDMQPFTPSDTIAARVEYHTDKRNWRQTECLSYDEGGSLVRKSVFAEYIENVFAGTMGERLGLRSGDIILQLRNWRYFDYDYIDFDSLEFSAALANTSAADPHIVVARAASDGGWEIIDLPITNSEIGINITSDWYPVETMDSIKLLYNAKYKEAG